MILQFAVLVLFMARKNFRNYPALFAYLLISILQSPFVYLVYSVWGYTTWTGFRISWISQTVVVASRWIAVCEVCHQILGDFRGIWGITWRLLAGIGGIVFAVGVLFGAHDVRRMTYTLDLGLECSIAFVLTFLFFFAAYYHVQINSSLKTIGVALCLYSCFRVLNDAVMQNFLAKYLSVWTTFDQITYLATMVLLAKALYVVQPEAMRKIELLPGTAYARLIPQVNDKLSQLNARLSQLLKSETAGKV
ncbi:MAG TPA: hypothetical protein VN025_02180 [Candidatus Dormibacteraeota bacterium]|nr:hypothetical protein [Candidatus Dormibacteraeota bacterium]